MKQTLALWLGILLCMFCILAAIVPLHAANVIEKPLDEGRKVAGDWDFEDSTISIGGMVYDSWGRSHYNSFATFDIRGWDHFTTNIGIDDNGNVDGIQHTSIEVDGDEVWKTDISAGQKAKFVDIPLTGKRTITLRWKSGDTVFAEPKLIKGNPQSPFACPVCNNKFNTQTEMNDHIKAVHNNKKSPTSQTNSPEFSPVAAPFVVDPKNLEELVANLRKRVDAKSEIQQKLAKGFMAVMTFTLIDIQSHSVAQNVAEDLSTKLTNADFKMVERAQLDKALKEMKIQDTGLIDQTTAQKLGQITGCNYIMVGSVSDRGQFLVVNARILETATGIAVAAESVECRRIEIKR